MESTASGPPRDAARLHPGEAQALHATLSSIADCTTNELLARVEEVARKNGAAELIYAAAKTKGVEVEEEFLPLIALTLKLAWCVGVIKNEWRNSIEDIMFGDATEVEMKEAGWCTGNVCGTECAATKRHGSGAVALGRPTCRGPKDAKLAPYKVAYMYRYCCTSSLSSLYTTPVRH